MGVLISMMRMRCSVAGKVSQPVSEKHRFTRPNAWVFRFDFVRSRLKDTIFPSEFRIREAT